MDKNSFGKRLKLFRKKSGLTQDDLADKIGVSYMTVRRWEAEKVTPRMDEIKKMCQVLNISEEELFNNSENAKWILTIKIADNKKEVIDLAQNMPLLSNFEITPYGGNFLVSASWEILKDDNKFQDLLDQLIDSREEILRTGKKMYEKIWKNRKDK